jgi:hypothetical protein
MLEEDMLALARYEAEDDYVIGEMILLYKSANSAKRIELLSEWHKQSYQLPFEVAALAVEDLDASVRYWMARNSRNLNYRDGDDSKSNRDLEARLRNDPIPAVGAAIFENPDLHMFFDGEVIDNFLKMSPFQRLAAMRNPKLGIDHARKIAEMDLPIDELESLFLALLTNHRFIKSSRSINSSDSHELAALWDAIVRWPYSRAKIEFFRRVGAPTSKKTEVFKSCQEPQLREAILEGCHPEDYDVLEVLALGTIDDDLRIRYLAYSKLPRDTTIRRLRTILKRPAAEKINTTEIRFKLRHDDRFVRFRPHWHYCLCGFGILGLGLALLYMGDDIGQRSLIGLLIIIYCSIKLHTGRLFFQSFQPESKAGEKPDDLVRLFGGKDYPTSCAEPTFERAEVLKHLKLRTTIFFVSHAVTLAVAVGALIFSIFI